DLTNTARTTPTAFIRRERSSTRCEMKVSCVPVSSCVTSAYPLVQLFYVLRPEEHPCRRERALRAPRFVAVGLPHVPASSGLPPRPRPPPGFRAPRPGVPADGRMSRAGTVEATAPLRPFAS